MVSKRIALAVAAAALMGCAESRTVKVDPNDPEQVRAYCGGATGEFLYCDGTCVRSVSEEHCGACNVRCASSASCVIQNDIPACVCKDESLSYCNGLCLDISRDMEHCGVCQNACLNLPNIKNPTCSGGRCYYQCTDGYSDCDDDPANGCESDLRSDPLHCGTCFKSCGTGQCLHGTCTPCPEGFSHIPRGTYRLGSPASEFGRQSDETQHDVTLTYDFCIMDFELSRLEYKNLLSTGDILPAHEYWLPKDMINWHEAAHAANAMSAALGKPACYVCAPNETGPELTCTSADDFLACTGIRLPTEAEWEIAARGATTTPLYKYRDDIIDQDGFIAALTDIAWFKNSSGGRTRTRLESQEKPDHRNPYGLYDVAGNVIEWVHDDYISLTDAPRTDPVSSPVSPTSKRVIRGGGYMSDATKCRHAQRESLEGNRRVTGLGARFVTNASE